MKTMRLVIAAPLYPPEIGGPATYARILEESLPEHDIAVSVVKFSEVRSLPPGVRTAAYFWNMFSALKDADLVLALDPVSTGFPTRIAAFLRRVPFVVKVVGDYAWEQGRQRFGMKKNLDDFLYERDLPFPVLVFKYIQTWVAKSARGVIVPSAYLKRIVTFWGVPEESVHVIYNALEREAVEPFAEAPDQMTRPWIVSVGRLVPWKGMSGLIDAVEVLRKDMPDASLIIAGDGPDRQQLERYAKARLKENYAFPGALEHADALALMKSADIFVLNSTYEGLSHLLIEALSLEVPIVATRAGGNGELIEDEVNGLLIPVNDTKALVEACKRILTDKALAKKLRSAPMDERFEKPTMLTHTARVLKELV